MALALGTAGLNIIKEFEGCRLTAYLCPANVWTIGYGHTSGVKSGQTITQAQADAYLVSDCAKFVSHVNGYQSKYNWNQNQFDALVSFAFNIGNIAQLTANGTRSNATIAEKILLYNKANGSVLSGLTRRRTAERELFLKAVTGSETTASTDTGNTSTGSTATSSTALTTKKQAQTWLKSTYSISITIDGILGAETKKALIKALQTELNNQTKAGLVIDGIWGTKTYNACITVKQGASGNITKIIQAMLILNGFSVGTSGIDGSYGSGTVSGVKSAQTAKKLASDGICGKNTFKAYLS